MSGVHRQHVQHVEAEPWAGGWGLAATIATTDAIARTGRRPNIRVLRARPLTDDQQLVDDDDLVSELVITVQVIPNPPADYPFPPRDVDQGESMVLNREQAVILRDTLDAFISEGRHESVAQQRVLRAQEQARLIAEQVRAGDLFGRPVVAPDRHEHCRFCSGDDCRLEHGAAPCEHPADERHGGEPCVDARDGTRFWADGELA